MKKHYKALLAAGVLLFAGTAVVSAAQGLHWSYSGETGPANWGRLGPEYSLCLTGRNQSPVDLRGFVHAELSPLGFRYQAKEAAVVHTGHTVQVNFAEGSVLDVAGHLYTLKQLHFHSPSEHLVQGHSFPMEAHLVHSDGNGQLAVIGILYETGEENAALNPILSVMPGLAGQKTAISGTFVAESLLPATRDYYRLSGSLTTPPCTEGVTWLVMKTPLRISQGQLDSLQKALGEANNRPVQPIYARVILD